MTIAKHAGDINCIQMREKHVPDLPGKHSVYACCLKAQPLNLLISEKAST